MTGIEGYGLSELKGMAEVMFQPRMGITDADLILARKRVERQVKGCTNCPLGERGCQVPMRVGEDVVGAAKVLVVGEAPGSVEDRRGLPFVGPAGRLMQAMMRSAGWDLDEVAWCNTISCWPEREPPTPKIEEMKACRSNLRDQVVASGATYVVLAGGIATSAWRSDLKVSDDRVRGGVYLWGKGTWIVMPVWHPAAVLRDPSKKTETIRHLAEFKDLATIGQDPMVWLSRYCIKCGDRCDHHDIDGVAFCARHWLKYGNQWRVEWERWSNDKAIEKVKNRRTGKLVSVIEGQETLV